MKKLILLVFIFQTWNCPAQSIAKHEIQIGYGPLARELVFNDALGNFFRTLAHLPAKHIDFSNSYSVTYRYQPNRKVALGLTSVVATGRSYKNYLFESASHYKHTSVILAFETKFIYVDKPLLTLYSLIGLGGLLLYEKNLDRPKTPTNIFNWPTCQLTPFGIRYGKKIGIFGELGYGYKGIINMGASLKL